jgi:hypothetical protein
LFKPTGFNCFHEFGEVVVQLVEDHIQPAALSALGCWWFPEFHAPILFEDVFDDKPFSQQNKEKQWPRTCTEPPNPNTQTHPPQTFPRHPLVLEPRPAPGGCLIGVARSWGQGWP